MAWVFLYLAGMFEIVWAGAMKASDGFRHPGWSALTLVAAVISFWLLSVAMRSLPLGTAYVIWVGVGAIGAFVLGILIWGETLSPVRVVSVLLILLGLIGLNLAERSGP